jgi:hypothetical protein
MSTLPCSTLSILGPALLELFTQTRFEKIVEEQVYG